MSIIQTRKCDVCQVSTTSDQGDYHQFGRFEDMNAHTYEVCAQCVDHLFTRHPKLGAIHAARLAQPA